MALERKLGQDFPRFDANCRNAGGTSPRKKLAIRPHRLAREHGQISGTKGLEKPQISGTKVLEKPQISRTKVLGKPGPTSPWGTLRAPP